MPHKSDICSCGAFERLTKCAIAYHDELFERADKGIGGVHEEKLRIAWLATGPYGRSTFELLRKKDSL